MAKLSKKAAKKIASLINSLVVAQSFCSEARAAADAAPLENEAVIQKSYATLALWGRCYSRTSVELADHYGIELPTLKTDREVRAAELAQWNANRAAS